MSKLPLKNILRKYGDFIYDHKYLLFILCGLSFLSIVDIPSSPVFKIQASVQKLYLIFVSVFKGLFLLTIMAPLFKKDWGRVIIIILTSIFAILSLANAISFHFYHIGITRKLILIFAQTTFDETKDFLPGLLNNLKYLLVKPGFYLAWVFIGILLYVITYMPKRLLSSLTISFGSLGFISFLIFSFLFSSGRSAHILTARVVKYGKEVWQSNKEYERLLHVKRPLQYKETVSSRNLASTVIVVLGESAHRRHHSLYGYPLVTNPCLETLSDSLAVFTDVIGSSMTTAGNMERILSFKEDDATCGNGLKFPLVIDLFNEMGYKTYWLSNQERTGTVSNTSGVMAMNAAVVNYIGADNSEDALSVRYDEALLPYLDEALSQEGPNKLIFLHLLGSHVEYKSRYPDSFNHFSAKDETTTFKSFDWLDKKSSQRRAEYDNSIRYTDMILGRIVEMIKKMKTPALMIYFSDHGEEVYDFSSYSGRNENTVQVPFIIYANAAYKSENREIMESMESAKSKPMSTANWVHMLITLTGGKYRLYNPELDVLSEDYIIRPRYVDEKIWSYDQ